MDAYFKGISFGSEGILIIIGYQNQGNDGILPVGRCFDLFDRGGKIEYVEISDFLILDTRIGKMQYQGIAFFYTLDIRRLVACKFEYDMPFTLIPSPEIHTPQLMTLSPA